MKQNVGKSLHWHYFVDFFVTISTVVPYIRDHGDLGFYGQRYHPKTKDITQKPASRYHPGALAVLVRYDQAYL